MARARTKNLELTQTSLAFRQARQATGQNQSDFARRIGISLPTLQRYETNGDPTLTALKLAISAIDRELASLKATADDLPAVLKEFGDSARLGDHIRQLASETNRKIEALTSARSVLDRSANFKKALESNQVQIIDRIAELEAENARLREDRERLEWLESLGWPLPDWVDRCFLEGESVRAAIDAARKGEGR